MLMLKSLSVLIVAASAAHALQSPAAASNLGERGLTDGTTGLLDNLPGLPGLGDLLGGGGKTTTGKVKRELDDFVSDTNSATPVKSPPGTDSALNDVTSDHNVLPQDAGLESLIPGLHKRQDEDEVDQDEDDVDSNSGLDAGAEVDADFDLVRRGYRKASEVKFKVNEPKPATFVKKSKKHPKTADKEHGKKHDGVHKKPDEEHKKHDEVPKKHHPVA
ncbi:hypothetical protein MVLG_01284 [Microbotryum lychnidis-dioicae p1A1 Lamole]|uniref:Uncharacterized protein n=1 Tax=Microbotryum lychnidis-dioicae (strain p1A1 Lamole / MvSl-1064) TaxID=683840 RepID=U5H1N0_USTV1|nr:hypothetical protein MVLG_01284 [Microbotryum lychnidis-dioicae p1A1 Lamole]|eukprot:KDE08504.1 hypothetical protein MVLG_01284 [Microbotryum lychnidis-dioicae p1A1 Lamole]